MKDAEFVQAFDNALFYSGLSGSVLFHPDDLARYLKLLPRDRW